MSYLGKEYKYQSHENFDGFLKSAGVPDDKVQAFMSFKPSQTLVKNGDSYTLTTTSPEGNKVVTFKSGVETDEEVAVGEHVKSTYSIEGNTVTQTVKGPRGTANLKKVYNGDELVVTITSDNWDGVARRVYKA